jgi:hypothetical protein
MSDVLRRVAMIHAERLEKANKKRLITKRKLAARVAYFRDSGIPEMWEDIKDIRIPNPAKDRIEGFTVTFADLVVPTCADTIEGAGLTLYDKHDLDATWYVQDTADVDAEQPLLVYTHTAPGSRNNARSLHIDTAKDDAKQKFVQSFIDWLARHITPQMLAEMDIDLRPQATVRPTRKFLQVAE